MMNKKKLNLHKVKVVKLTHLTKILGGSENSETTYTTTGNDDSDTQGPTSTTTNSGAITCPTSLADDCQSNTNDTSNDNNSVPPFNCIIFP